MKQCKKCNETKDESCFPKDRERTNNTCRLCNKEYCAKKYLRHKQSEAFLIKKKEKADEYRRENRDSIRERYNKNVIEYKAKKKLYYEKNKEYIKEKAREYSKINKGICNANRAKKKAIKLRATPKWLTTEHMNEIKKIYIKAQEMEKETGIKYHVDHIVPMQGKTVSGLHVPWNLQILEASENIRKGNRI